jgi:hypothetical protein
MRIKKRLFAAFAILAASVATPALAGQPHVDISVVFGFPGVYSAPPPVVVYPEPRPPAVIVYPAPRPPVVVYPAREEYRVSTRYYYPRERYYERRDWEREHGYERHKHKARYRGDDRWE